MTPRPVRQPRDWANSGEMYLAGLAEAFVCEEAAPQLAEWKLRRQPMLPGNSMKRGPIRLCLALHASIRGSRQTRSASHRQSTCRRQTSNRARHSSNTVLEAIHAEPESHQTWHPSPTASRRTQKREKEFAGIGLGEGNGATGNAATLRGKPSANPESNSNAKNESDAYLLHFSGLFGL